MSIQAGNAPIAYLTSGAGGMICGSCLHDNTLARALQRRGVDVHLIPTYTPIRTDEENVSESHLFFGGVNVFLAQSVPLFRRLPLALTRWLDHPAFIRWVTRRASATSAATLGALTVSMLRGVEGNQRRETEQLCAWLATLQPRLIVLSNALIAGCVPRLKQLLQVPVLVTLQGDDIFLDALPEPHRGRALAELQKLIPQIDAFLVNSRFYAGRMQRMLAIPESRFVHVPLGIDTQGFPDSQLPSASPPQPPTIGYLARIAPEKGFHLLIEAFVELWKRGNVPNVRLHAAGWKGPQHAEYFAHQLEKLRDAGCEHAFTYAGTLTRQQKIDFLRGLTLFSAPTTYEEPKGLFVLEALAAGVPVVQPSHGAFPELLHATGGGRLVHPHDPLALALAWEELLLNEHERYELAVTGQRNVHASFNADTMAGAVWQAWEQFLVRDR